MVTMVRPTARSNAGEERHVLAVIPVELYDLDPGVFLPETFEQHFRVVRAAVVDVEDLVGPAHGAEGLLQALVQLGQGFFLVENRHEDRYIDAIVHVPL